MDAFKWKTQTAMPTRTTWYLIQLRLREGTHGINTLDLLAILIIWNSCNNIEFVTAADLDGAAHGNVTSQTFARRAFPSGPWIFSVTTNSPPFS